MIECEWEIYNRLKFLWRKKMELIRKFFMLLYLLLSFFSIVSSESSIHFKLKRINEVGNTKPLFIIITSVCEDSSGNYYVCDPRAHKVYKFAPDGEFLTGFGQEGQGPGDFHYPRYIDVSNKNELIVFERNYISIFHTNGKFKSKIKCASLLSYARSWRYAGGDLYCAIKFTQFNRDVIQNIVIVNNKGKIIHESLFLLPPPMNVVVSHSSSSGREYRFGFTEVTPEFLFHHYKNLSVAALSNKYKLLILDEKGKIVAQIIREVEPPLLSHGEREYIKKSFTKRARWPDHIKKEIISQIPNKKTILNKIFITSKYVIVLKFSGNLFDKISSSPTDIYSISGTYLGTAQLKVNPKYIYDKYIYTKEKSSEDDMLLVRYGYELKRNNAGGELGVINTILLKLEGS